MQAIQKTVAPKIESMVKQISNKQERSLSKIQMIMAFVKKHSVTQLLVAALKTILLFMFAPLIIGWYTTLFVLSQFKTSIFCKPRKDLSYKTILITGAATGLGRALALQYASPGTTIIIQDDKQVEKELTELSTQLEERGSKVEVGVLDSSNKKSISNWMVDMQNKHGVIYMFVSNSHYNEAGRFDKEVQDVNVAGTFEMLLPVLEETKKVTPKVTQQVVIITTPTAIMESLTTGFSGLSFKQMLNFGSSLRRAVNTTHGLRVNVILPGFISMHGQKRSILDRLIGITDRKAAATIQTRLLWDVPFISLANSAYLFSWFAGLLPLPIMDFAQMYLKRSPVAQAMKEVMQAAEEQSKVVKDKPTKIQAAHPHVSKTHLHHELTQEEQDQVLAETTGIRKDAVKTPLPDLLPLEDFAVPQRLSNAPKKEKKPKKQLPAEVHEEKHLPAIIQGHGLPVIVEDKPIEIVRPQRPEEHKELHYPVVLEDKPIEIVKPQKLKSTSTETVDPVARASSPDVQPIQEKKLTEEELFIQTLPAEAVEIVEADKAMLREMYSLPSNARVRILEYKEEVVERPKMPTNIRTQDDIVIEDGVLIADESPEVADEIVSGARLREQELLMTCSEDELRMIRDDKQAIITKYSLPSNARVVLVDLIDDENMDQMKTLEQVEAEMFAATL